MALNCSVATGAWNKTEGASANQAYAARRGHVSESGLHIDIDNLLPLLRPILVNTDVATANLYSSHSLQRGFANWATSNGWDLKILMEYVGWKNVQSAMRYVEVADPFGKRRIGHAMIKILHEYNYRKETP